MKIIRKIVDECNIERYVLFNGLIVIEKFGGYCMYFRGKLLYCFRPFF